MMIYIFFSLIYIFFFNSSKAELLSNYKSYSKTKLNLEIVKVSQENLNYPWGMTFIDKNTLLITEKNGGLIKTDVKSGKSVNVQQKIPLLKKRNGQGGLLDVYAHTDGFIYFLSSTTIAKNEIDEDE